MSPQKCEAGADAVEADAELKHLVENQASQDWKRHLTLALSPTEAERGNASVFERKKPDSGLVAFDRDERTLPEGVGLLIEDLDHILADARGTNVIETQLDDAGQSRAAFKKEFGEIEVLRQDNRPVCQRPLEDFSIGSVGRAEFAPVTGIMAVLPEMLHPRNG